MAADELNFERTNAAAARVAAARFIDLRPAPADPRREIAAGLAAPQASLPPKFFYDTLGSRLFEAICELPEYTLMRDERALLDEHAAEIGARIGAGSALVDLGAGNCEKAERLFEWLQPSQYVAIDFAAEFLRQRLAALAERYPQIAMIGIAQDFSRGLALPPPVAARPRTLFYPGSSIGNFSTQQAQQFLARARAACGDFGHLIVGADLAKPRRELELAYDDPLGVTAAFNLNLLNNVNALLGSNFDAADWKHVARYDEPGARVQMFLEARRDVVVRWPDGARSFAAGERIHTENSHKYTPARLRSMLLYAGFAAVEVYTDGRFAVALASA